MSIMVQMISFVIASFRTDACLHTPLQVIYRIVEEAGLY